MASFIFASENNPVDSPERMDDFKCVNASSKANGGGSCAVNSWSGIIFNAPLCIHTYINASPSLGNTLFSAVSGFSHVGICSADSISINSPSESWILITTLSKRLLTCQKTYTMIHSSRLTPLSEPRSIVPRRAWPEVSRVKVKGSWLHM